MPYSPHNHAIKAFAIAAMASCRAFAGDQGLADKYLLCVKLEKPAVFSYKEYLKKFRYADFAQELKDKGFSDDDNEAQEYWKDRFAEDFTLDYFSFIFQSSFSVSHGSKLTGLVRIKDTGEGIPCAVDNDGNGDDNVKSPKNIPFVVESATTGEILLRETLSGSSVFSSFDEAEWRNYFWMGGSWHDPATRMIWITSWEELKKRWDGFLEQRDFAEVRAQMKVIGDAGRFRQQGGEVWHRNIATYYNASSGLWPKLDIVNSTGGSRQGDVAWSRNGRAEGRILQLEEKGPGNAWRCTPPFGEFNGNLTATVRLWIPGYDCCGIATNVINVQSPFDNARIDFSHGSAPWETNSKATVKVKLTNIKNRDCALFVNGEQQKKISGLDEFEWEYKVTAHLIDLTIEVKDGKEKVLGSFTIDKKYLHRGLTAIIKPIRLNDPKPKETIKKQKANLPAGLSREEALFRIQIDKDYAIFNGDSEHYDTSAMANYTKVGNGGEIPVKILMADTDDPPRGLIKELANNVAKGAYADFSSPRWTPADGTWIEVPATNIYVFEWNNCKEYLDSLSLAGHHEIRDSFLRELANLSKRRQYWQTQIAEYQRSLFPRTTFENRSGKDVVIAIDGKEVVMEANKRLECVFETGRWPSKIVVREKDSDVEYSEYENNSLPTGNKETHILAGHLKHKSDPLIQISLPFFATGTLRFNATTHPFKSSTSIACPLSRREKVTELKLEIDRFEDLDLLPRLRDDAKYLGLKYGEKRQIKLETGDLRRKQDPKDPALDQPDRSWTMPSIDKFPKALRNLPKHVNVINEEKPNLKEGKETQRYRDAVKLIRDAFAKSSAWLDDIGKHCKFPDVAEDEKESYVQIYVVGCVFGVLDTDAQPLPSKKKLEQDKNTYENIKVVLDCL